MDFSLCAGSAGSSTKGEREGEIKKPGVIARPARLSANPDDQRARVASQQSTILVDREKNLSQSSPPRKRSLWTKNLKTSPPVHFWPFQPMFKGFF
jgi:hypothetical protein